MSRLVRVVLMVVVAIEFSAGAAPAFAQEAVGDRDAASSAERRELRQERRLRVMEARLSRGLPTRHVGALYSQTVGGRPSPQALPSPVVSLSIEDDFDLGRYVFQNGTPFIHNDGGGSYSNTAIGLDAMTSLVLGNPPYYGDQNTAVGAHALAYTMDGSLNTAVGAFALSGNTTGYGNTAVGAGAGSGWMSGSDNIAIGSGSYGYDTDSGTIRIGGYERQSAAYIEGIRGVTTGQNNAIAVMIDAQGQLGTMSSSAGVKEDISDLGDLSDRLLDLRPVAFRYRQPFNDGEKPIQFGLVAEEVAEAFPELVVYDDNGEPESVKYHWLSTLLLNELQKEKVEIEHLRRQVAELRRLVADLGPQGD